MESMEKHCITSLTERKTIPDFRNTQILQICIFVLEKTEM